MLGDSQFFTCVMLDIDALSSVLNTFLMNIAIYIINYTPTNV